MTALGSLLFGRMYEDSSIEASAFAAAQVAEDAPVLCIASAGCTALALAARGYAVTAIDRNPAQIAYLSERMAGAPPREGRIDRLLSLGRRRLRLLGANEDSLREFLFLADPEAQISAWRQHAQAPLWHAVVDDMLISLWTRAGVMPDSTLRDDIRKMLQQRFEIGLSRHANRENPYLWRLFIGCDPPIANDANRAQPAIDFGSQLVVKVADVIAFLESAPARHFAALSLSNLEDVLSADDLAQLHRAIAHAARPDAVVVRRSLSPTAIPSEAEWAARDRSFLWGRISVLRAGERVSS